MVVSGRLEPLVGACRLDQGAADIRQVGGASGESVELAVAGSGIERCGVRRVIMNLDLFDKSKLRQWLEILVATVEAPD